MKTINKVIFCCLWLVLFSVFMLIDQQNSLGQTQLMPLPNKSAIPNFQRLSPPTEGTTPSANSRQTPLTELTDMSLIKEDRELLQLYKSYLNERLQYEKEYFTSQNKRNLMLLERDTKLFREQELAFAYSRKISIVIFYVVHFILLCAVAFSILEIISAGYLRKKIREKQEIEINLEGIAMKTSMIGLLLLSIAFAFYLLYLKFVYPVTSVAV
jgi:hypothetical protein